MTPSPNFSVQSRGRPKKKHQSLDLCPFLPAPYRVPKASSYRVVHGRTPLRRRGPSDPSRIASPAGSQNAAQIEYIDTADHVGIETEQMRIIFDRHSGRLTALRNQVTQDEYLKEPGNRGNPFRLYSGFIRPFELEDDPADIAATAIDPRFCRVKSVSRVEGPRGRGFRLVARDASNCWETRLEIVAASPHHGMDFGSGQRRVRVREGHGGLSVSGPSLPGKKPAEKLGHGTRSGGVHRPRPGLQGGHIRQRA